MKTFTIVAGVILIGVLGIKAQQAQQAQEPMPDLTTLPIVTEPAPSGTLLSQAPSYSKWMITSTHVGGEIKSDLPNQPSTKPIPLLVTKSDKIYMVESIGSDGKKMVRWSRPPFQATYVDGMTRPLIDFGNGSPFAINFSKSDFPDLSWVSARNFVGTTQIGKVKFMVFKASVATQGGAMPLAARPHHTPSDVVAVVDLETRMPVMMQVENELLTYQFATTAPAPLTFPKEAEDEINFLEKRMKQAAALPPG